MSAPTLKTLVRRWLLFLYATNICFRQAAGSQQSSSVEQAQGRELQEGRQQDALPQTASDFAAQTASDSAAQTASDPAALVASDFAAPAASDSAVLVASDFAAQAASDFATQTSVTPRLASHFTIPPAWQIDHAQMQQQLQQLAMPAQHARFWLQLANADRPFSHSAHQPFARRGPITERDVSRHLTFDANEDVRTVQTPFGLLLAVTDNMFAASAAAGGVVTPVLVGNGIESMMQLGKRLVLEVMHRANLDTGHSQGGCAICRLRYQSRYFFIPQSVDAHHTVATRLVPLCDIDDCENRLRLKLTSYSSHDNCAHIPGLRVFFRINGSIAVYESEHDPYKLVLNKPDSAGGSHVMFDGGDFTSHAVATSPLILYDQFGRPYALPPRVAAKANMLACALLLEV